MITVYSTSPTPKIDSCLATIGNFDGVHLGHTALINACVEKAKRENLPSVLITFDPHPSTVVGKKPILPLTRLSKRLDLIEAHGIDYCFVLPFNESFAKQDSELFVKDFIKETLHCKELFVGFNFRMGSDNKDTQALAEILKAYDCKLFIQNEVAYFDENENKNPVSSTSIRKALEEGNIKLCNALLNRRHCVTGQVVHGAKRGSTLLGFPTANMDTGNLLLPKPGVYATISSVFDDNKQESKQYKSISNIGYNPTFAGDKLLIETYIIDFNELIYDKKLKVCFLERIRDERKFSSPKELIEQLTTDKKYRTDLEEE